MASLEPRLRAREPVPASFHYGLLFALMSCSTGADLLLDWMREALEPRAAHGRPPRGARRYRAGRSYVLFWNVRGSLDAPAVPRPRDRLTGPGPDPVAKGTVALYYRGRTAAPGRHWRRADREPGDGRRAAEWGTHDRFLRWPTMRSSSGRLRAIGGRCSCATMRAGWLGRRRRARRPVGDPRAEHRSEHALRRSEADYVMVRIPARGESRRWSTTWSFPR